MREPAYCPYCKGRIRQITADGYYCESCHAVIMIEVEYASTDSPLLWE